MQFRFSTLDRPKSVAKALRDAVAPIGIKLTIVRAQTLTAQLYGYRTWKELAGAIGQNPPSLEDREAGPEIARTRLDQQLGVIFDLTGNIRESQRIVNILNPTGNQARMSGISSAKKTRSRK